jgi:hypothetical protein
MNLCTLLLCVLSIGEQSKDSTFEQMLQTNQLEKAVLYLVQLKSTSADSNTIDSYFSRLDSSLQLQNKKEIPNSKPDSTSWPKGTLVYSVNAEYAHGSTKSRLLLCTLWTNYLKIYVKGNLYKRFQLNILRHATSEYDSLKEMIAKSYLRSETAALRKEGLGYLALKAQSQSRYEDAFGYYTTLFTITHDKKSLAKLSLLMAECFYFSDKIDDAMRGLSAACQISTEDDGGSACGVKELWMKDFKAVQENSKAAKKQHIIIRFF